MANNKKVYVLTNFSTYLKSFSPILVVGEQLLMMKRAGYEPVLITSEGWNPPEDSIFNQVETKLILAPQTDGDNADEAFDLDVARLSAELSDIIDDGSVVITHDLLFMPDLVKYNVACREIAQRRPSIFWLHWLHSATNPQILIQERTMFSDTYKEMLNTKFPNSLICYPNSYDIPRVARNFGYEENEVVEVPHSTYPVEGMQPVVKRLYDQLKLWKPGVLMVYPLRLDRGKQAEVNVKIMKGCKDNDMESHLIFCDFQSTGDDKVVYREDLKQLARELDVEDRVTFLSEFEESSSLESSHQVVLDLFTLSNVFCLPSKSETYSLVAQEAMLKGNLCILNQDFPPMRQIYGQRGLYKQFSGNIGIDGLNGEINTVHTPEDVWYKNLASAIHYYIEQEKGLSGKTFVRVHRNPDYIMQKYLEPLLNLESDATL